MKPFLSHLACLLLPVATCSISHAETPATSLVVGGRILTLQASPACAQAQQPGKALARYLRQYDPSGDPKEDIRDETPWSAQDIQLVKDGLVESGFHYPNGQDSVITWMDANGDGRCDFTASAGIGGMKAVDRMFLFFGLPDGGFRLVDAYYTYMEGSSIVVPYIPITVAGERLPVLANRSTLLQWDNGRRQFATCESIRYGPQARRRFAPRALTALCPHVQQIYTWAAAQMPHENEIPYSNVE